MDIKTYKTNLKKQLAKAGELSGVLVEVAPNSKTGTAKERAAAILKADIDPEKMQAFVEAHLETVANMNELVTVRLAAMKALKAARFQGPLFEPYLDDYHSTLRKVSEDRSPNLRDSAVSTLAVAKDSYIYDKLLNGLEKKIKPLVPEDKAIRYLSYDEHIGAAKIVREMYEKLSDRSKESALRMLASDKKSEGILSNVMADKRTKSSLRTLSAAGLKNLNPKSFKDLAEKIISNDTEFDEIKALCVSALTNNIKGDRELIDDGIIQKVKDIKSNSRNLRSAVKRFVKLL